MRLPCVAISMGDPAGIGPEIAIKAALDPRVRAACRPLLVGDPTALAAHAKGAGLSPRIIETEKAANAVWEGDALPLLVRRHLQGALTFGEQSAANGRAIIDCAGAAIDAALAGHVDAVVAAPQNEKSVNMAGIAFDGYPTFVARRTGVPEEDAFLMLWFDDTRIVHTTLHVGLRRALELITRERVGHAIAAADTALRKLGFANPKIAVSGLNPHAGEDGLFGSEEQQIIAPAIDDARKAGIQVEGPYGADTMFGKKGYDAFLVMFHDQGHICAKVQAFDRTSGFTIGTPVLFSSVAHGSAHDIAGKGQANPRAIIDTVLRLARVRPTVAAA